MEPVRSLLHSKAPPPTVPILNHINPVHALSFHFLKIHCNIILPSTHRSSETNRSVTHIVWLQNERYAHTSEKIPAYGAVA